MEGLVKYQSDSGEVSLSPEMIKKYLVNGNGAVTEPEVLMFLNLCKYQKLNPFLREAYLIKFGTQQATIVTGKEVFTKRAMKNENFRGMEAGIVVVNLKGEVEERKGAISLDGETLVGGWAKVYKNGYEVPIEGTASMKEYCRMKDGRPMSSWASMPATMIRKVALVQALREAFPDDFQGLYSQEEMPVDNSALNTEPIQTTTIEENQSNVIDVLDKGTGLEKISILEHNALVSAISKANISDELVLEVLKKYEYENTTDIEIKNYKNVVNDLKKIAGIKE